MASGSLTTQTTTQNGLRVFANAFKGYMGLMPVIMAALAPLLTFLKAIPTYDSQRTTLATLSGVLGFWLLAWLFYIRRTIALGSFVRGFPIPHKHHPALADVGTVDSFIGYFQVLSTGKALELADKEHWKYVEKDKESDFKTGSDVLKHWDDRPIPDSVLLELFYLAIFLSAEKCLCSNGPAGMHQRYPTSLRTGMDIRETGCGSFNRRAKE